LSSPPFEGWRGWLTSPAERKTMTLFEHWKLHPEFYTRDFISFVLLIVVHVMMYKLFFEKGKDDDR
jgi:hypothetical protein